MVLPKREIPGFFASALAILRKDLAIELRTREIVTTGGFFAILVTVMASIAFSAGPKTQVRIAPGAIWLPIAFASVLALGRTWQREREESALTGLLVSPVSRPAIFVGKGLGVFFLLLAVEALVVPVVALLFHVELLQYLSKITPILLLGTLGVSATGTLFG
ncbi:MAG: heme exporter protein CcmB, partial [Myxococcales bacterium]|nr:heme exporter protein CcmB [Myxococcales bacterium]